MKGKEKFLSANAVIAEFLAYKISDSDKWKNAVDEPEWVIKSNLSDRNALKNFLKVTSYLPFNKIKKKLKHVHEKHLVSPSHDSKTKEGKRNSWIRLIFIKPLYIFLFYFFLVLVL